MSISYGIVHSVCGGVLDVPRSVYKGSFDKYLISPKNIIMRILPSHIDTSAIGDVIYGTICLVGFVIMLDLNLLQIIVLILSLIFSIVLFLGLSIFISSISFFINDSLTVSRTLIDLVMTPAIQNGGMIQGKMRFLFTFIIPSLIISIIPIEVIISLDIYKLFMIFIISII
ncbi:MAG: ABC-2 family transporter protein [Cyanobium sp. MAG06]|nr:ABC-2 family transporter protein [Cyanobium sp. MAG06]